MSWLANRSARFRIAFYAGALGVVMAVFLCQWNPGKTLEIPINSLNSLQDQELKALLDMNSLITTLDTGLLGALGYLMINGRKVSRWSGTMWLAFFSAASAALSLLFGYVVYLGVIRMLEWGFFDLNNPSIQWARSAHFYTFLLAVVLFGDFAFQTLHEEGHDVRTPDVVGG
jgi:hypothetical protein